MVRDEFLHKWGWDGMQFMCRDIVACGRACHHAVSSFLSDANCRPVDLEAADVFLQVESCP